MQNSQQTRQTAGRNQQSKNRFLSLFMFCFFGTMQRKWCEYGFSSEETQYSHYYYARIDSNTVNQDIPPGGTAAGHKGLMKFIQPGETGTEESGCY